MKRRPPVDPLIPDVRDGLTRVERVILWELQKLQKERDGRNVSTAQLYGRVAEHVNITPQQMQLLLARMGARKL